MYDDLLHFVFLFCFFILSCFLLCDDIRMIHNVCFVFVCFVCFIKTIDYLFNILEQTNGMIDYVSNHIIYIILNTRFILLVYPFCYSYSYSYGQSTYYVAKMRIFYLSFFIFGKSEFFFYTLFIYLLLLLFLLRLYNYYYHGMGAKIFKLFEWQC